METMQEEVGTVPTMMGVPTDVVRKDYPLKNDIKNFPCNPTISLDLEIRRRRL